MPQGRPAGCLSHASSLQRLRPRRKVILFARQLHGVPHVDGVTVSLQLLTLCLAPSTVGTCSLPGEMLALRDAGSFQGAHWCVPPDRLPAVLGFARLARWVRFPPGPTCQHFRWDVLSNSAIGKVRP